MESPTEKFDRLNAEFDVASNRLEMTRDLYDSVVERTGKFEEGFHASKRLGMSARKKLAEFQEKRLNATTLEELVDLLENMIHTFEVMTQDAILEIDKLDGK